MMLSDTTIYVKFQKSLSLVATYALLIALLALSATFTAIKPVFLSPENIIGIVHQVSIIGIMSLGMTFVIMTGGIDLSVGPVLAIAGLASAFLLEMTGGSTGMALLGAVGVGAFIGSLNGVCVAYLGLAPIVVTLASLSIVRGVALLMGGPALHLIREPESFLFIGSGTIGTIPFSVFLFLGLALLMTLLQYKSSFGMLVLAVGDNERAAFLNGSKTKWIKTLTYIICGVGAAISGVIQASQVHTATATYGVGIELDVIAAVVLGGASLMGGSGTVVRTMLGVLLIGVINNGLSLLNIPIEMQLIAKGLIIVIALGLRQFERK